MFEELAQKIIDEHHADPRNKVFVTEDVLLASVLEESGTNIDHQTLSAVVCAYEDGTITDEQQELYDAATYACSYIGKKCFAEDPEDEDEEVDISISFSDVTSDTVVAEVRPN